MISRKSKYVREYEQLAAKLVRLRNEEGHNVIMLTSCEEKVGVSTLAYNLAHSLAARSSERVVGIITGAGFREIGTLAQLEPIRGSVNIGDTELERLL